jgi:hypothetical protein
MCPWHHRPDNERTVTTNHMQVQVQDGVHPQKDLVPLDWAGRRRAPQLKVVGPSNITSIDYCHDMIIVIKRLGTVVGTTTRTRETS